MNLNTFIRLAKIYNGLGWAVQDQLDDVLSGAVLEDLNPNALSLMSDLIEEATAAGVEDDHGVKDDIDEFLGE